MKVSAEELIDKMAEEWNGDFVPRKKLKKFSWGMITDRVGIYFEEKGELTPIKMGGRIYYYKPELVETLKKNSRHTRGKKD